MRGKLPLASRTVAKPAAVARIALAPDRTGRLKTATVNVARERERSSVSHADLTCDFHEGESDRYPQALRLRAIACP